MGRVNLKTREGFQQTLEVAFEPVISAQTGSYSVVETRICLESMNVIASRMSNVKSPSFSSSAQEDGLPPYFASEITTISVGASGGACIGPRKYSPKQSDFLERRTISCRSQWEAAFEGAMLPKGSVKYSHGVGISNELIPTTIGLDPMDFGSGRFGCKRWQYKVLESYKTNLECSRTCPPIHEASFMFDSASMANFPTYLFARVKTDFQLQRSRFSYPELRRNFLRSRMRHISVCLEVRVRRSDPEDYYSFPTHDKIGGIVEITIQLDESEIGQGIPHVLRPSAAVEAGFVQQNFP